MLGAVGRMVIGVWIKDDDGGTMKRMTGSALPARLFRKWQRRCVKARDNVRVAKIRGEIYYCTSCKKIQL